MLVDAIRKATGKPVYIKKFETDDAGLCIASMFVQGEVDSRPTKPLCSNGVPEPRGSEYIKYGHAFATTGGQSSS